MRGKEETIITEIIGKRFMPLMVYLYYNWPKERVKYVLILGYKLVKIGNKPAKS
jgi:hypothetical protein